MATEHVNAQSLQSNFKEIQMCVHDRGIDVLYSSEIWLHTHSPHELFIIPSYVMYRCDNGQGGGVCIYAKKERKAHSTTLPFSRKEGVEDLCVTVQNNKYPTVIIRCVYRHPKATMNP